MNIFKFLAILFSIFITLNAQEQIDTDGLKLAKSYPKYINQFKDNQIVFNDGTLMIFNDFDNNKSFESMLNHPSLKDQMRLKYTTFEDNPYYVPHINESPGRIRYEPFFKKMYGANEKEVREKLVKIKWMPKTVNKTVYITSINDVDKHLQDVSNELDNLPPDLKKYVNNPAGTFIWRKIAKSNRTSTHSFGIAIDINTKNSNYWLWNKDKNSPSYKNKIPLEIVKIFEKHGFIWGGKWYQYDTMHFEYRPELL